jgi:porphobilinogen deaminase
MGDKDQIKPLAEFDAKGLFTKELDIAQLVMPSIAHNTPPHHETHPHAASQNGDVDIVVHCLKDLPTQLPDGIGTPHQLSSILALYLKLLTPIVLGVILERGDVEDVVVMHPKHAGTTSNRLLVSHSSPI